MTENVTHEVGEGRSIGAFDDHFTDDSCHDNFTSGTEHIKRSLFFTNFARCGLRLLILEQHRRFCNPSN
jgi:hypothetical protein